MQYSSHCVFTLRLPRKLKRRSCRVRALHQRDLAAGYGEVSLPFALARKYPRAAYAA